VHRFVALVCAALIAGCPRPGEPGRSRPADLALHAVDVGQGDALLLLVGEGPQRRVVLVDAGPPNGTDALLAALRSHAVAAIDLLVLSHAHLDHIGGVERVLDAVPVRAVLDSGVPHTTATYRRVLRRLLALKEQGTLSYRVARRGQSLRLGPQTVLHVLGPEEPLVRGSRSDVNANSVVVRVVHGKTALLFLGDAERETEERLLASGEDLSADVVKVPHHGSRHASSAALLARVRPKIALISCGRANEYGHPAPATLERLLAASAAVHRTDLSGTISVYSDGEEVRVDAGTSLRPPARAPPPGLVGSRRGRVYHAPGCPGAGRIRAENRVLFRDRAEAEREGRTPHRCVEDR
jgi:competence protein ComEC